MTLQEFKKQILDNAANRPKDWRLGQAVFNSLGNIARYVQFQKNIDCFYDDDVIDDFLEAAYNHIQEEHLGLTQFNIY